MSELILTLILPVSFLITGGIMWRFPAQYKGLGYHTTLAESSPAAWAYAQRLCARLLTIGHIPVLMLTAAVIIVCAVLKVSESTAVALTLVVTAVQTVVVFALLFTVEAKLKKKFDRNGSLKE